MKKTAIAWVLLLCLLLTGCDVTWMDGEYHNVTPHLQEDIQTDTLQATCTSYAQIKDALVELVENGSVKGVIYVEGFTPEQMDVHMSDAIHYALNLNAIGNYAVEEIRYEIGTNAAVPAVAVEITYHHSRSEILRIKRMTSMNAAVNLITQALDSCSDRLVVFVERYNSMDIAQLVSDYVDNNPHICMELPQVSVTTYPERGIQRVVEITFTYQSSRESLRSMQDTVRPIFSSAELYVQGDAGEWEKFSLLYAFLMERYEYKVETSITPTYSLLRHGVGDSKAFALVYAQMCRKAGLDCQTVLGTKAGEAWYWNIIRAEDVYYHVDLLECNLTGVFQAKTTEEMEGYVWDYSAFDM